MYCICTGLLDAHGFSASELVSAFDPVICVTLLIIIYRIRTALRTGKKI